MKPKRILLFLILSIQTLSYSQTESRLLVYNEIDSFFLVTPLELKKINYSFELSDLKSDSITYLNKKISLQDSIIEIKSNQLKTCMINDTISDQINANLDFQNTVLVAENDDYKHQVQNLKTKGKVLTFVGSTLGIVGGFMLSNLINN